MYYKVLIGEKPDLRTSDKHLEKKISMTRESDFITGNCFWYGYQIADNESGIFSVLKDKYHTTKALIPAFEKIDNRIPDNVKKLKAEWTVNGYKLMWNSDKNEDEILKHAYYCIYRFHNKEKVDISNSENIVAITKDNSYLLPYENGKTKYIYVVTALNRLHTESEPEKKKVKL